jgi:excinuclease ABC subunit A
MPAAKKTNKTNSKTNGRAKAAKSETASAKVAGKAVVVKNPVTKRSRPKTAVDSKVKTPPNRNLIIRGARVNNLKNVSLELPRNNLIVITGVSGSGKSSLAFDTIYAEGQRRYVESLSAYARQFLERMNKPDVDFIQGIAPAISIEQKTISKNPRSTVGTTTEIYDYLRLLYARIGKTYCLNEGQLVRRDSVQTVLDRLEAIEDGARLYILFPLHSHEGHSIEEELETLRKRGFARIFVKGDIFDLEDIQSIDADKTDIYVLVDRLGWKRDDTSRITDSLETAFNEGDGYIRLRFHESGEEWNFSNRYECSVCATAYIEPDPQLFSFNSPAGACPMCQGFGRTTGIDPNLVIPNEKLSLSENAVQPWSTPKHSKHQRDLLRSAKEKGIPTDVPWRELSEAQREFVWKGAKGFKGIRGFFKTVEDKNYKMHYRILMARYRGYTTCEKCEGSRLRPDARATLISGKSLGELVVMSIEKLRDFFLSVELNEYETEVAERILEEINKRLGILVDIGLSYLTLDRLSHTLSGGESQRINIAASLGSTLVGALYVLDEPTIGLHPRDNARLIDILMSIRNLGNTVLVVEHDAEMMQLADLIVDIGPLAGENGGEIVAIATPKKIIRHKNSLTGQFLAGKLEIPIPKMRRKSAHSVTIIEPKQHNLKGDDIKVPLGVMTVVTGVSGSGKSTLVYDVLYGGLKKDLEGVFEGELGSFAGFKGSAYIKHVAMVDQSPIGRTPRSNPITYIKAFDAIRDVFASTPKSKIQGYAPGYFSFNVPGGRCDVCEGDGYIKVEMQFMADLFLECEACKGSRYKKEILDVEFRGKNIVDVLNMTVAEGLKFFASVPRITNRLKVLDDVGLGYMRLGQSATTLSGGEAQRLKLALHLYSRSTEHTLFIFDEPTTGLHPYDIQKLLDCFNALIDAGHSVLIIEHNLDVIKNADWVIDLGPDGGEAGGKLIAEGTPEVLIKSRKSHTAKYLKKVM